MHPLILTLKLDDVLSTELTAWRQRYFPPERNYLAAHVTLFHALPGDRIAAVADDVRQVAAARESFEVRVPGAYSLGRGVALEVSNPCIVPMRRGLRDRWLEWLSPQDRTAAIRPHVTVQNKVSPEVAKATLSEVRARWDANTRGRALGLSLWEYRGGPWEFVADALFQD